MYLSHYCKSIALKPLAMPSPHPADTPQEKQTRSPHDQFAKALFQKIERIRAFFMAVLPAEVRILINWDTLKPGTTQHVTPSLVQTLADKSFTVKYKNGGEAHLVLLLEHKSYVPGTANPIHVQLLEYMVMQFKEHLTSQQEQTSTPDIPRLPAVIPVVLYHGKDKWKHETFNSLFEGKEPLPQHMHKYIPSFDYVLVNLVEKSDEELKAIFSMQRLVKLSMLLMKHASLGTVEGAARSIFAELPMLLESTEDEDFLLSVWTYLSYAVANPEGLNHVIQEVEDIDKESADKVMSAYEQMMSQATLKGVQKGKLEGRREGKLEGKLEDAKMMKLDGLPVEAIQRYTGLSKEEIEAIK